MSHIPRASKAQIPPSPTMTRQLPPPIQSGQQYDPNSDPYSPLSPSIPNSAMTPGSQSRGDSGMYNMYSLSRESNMRVLTTGAEEDRDTDAIRVVIRARPMNSLEKQRNDGQSVFVLSDGQTLQIQANDPKLSRPITFNRTYDEIANQEYVFDNCGVKTLIDRALDGYNTTVFAFGQTGSGKTFTITGPEDTSFSAEESQFWGIVPRGLKYLFDSITQRQATQDVRFTVRACYLEIYNEQVQDLLNPSNSSLPVRWTSERGFYVENLFIVECEVLDDCFAVLEEGLRNRKTGAHRLNEHSSRSHGLMTVYIESETIDPDDQRVIRKTGKVCFVDLAGSEKVKESQATGDTLTETLNINKSLLTLGNCISALADMKRKKSGNGNIHVPYRDSKLTKLLSDSLGGNGITLMIACISPSSYNLHETLNTLRYASRAKRIQNRPVVQMDPREELIMQLKKEVKLLKTENEQLRQIVIDFSGTGTGLPPSRTPTGSRFPALPSPSVKANNHHQSYFPPADQNAAHGPNDSSELSHTKQLLAKFIDENQEIKNQNVELVSGRHQLVRENNELMEENDRLIGKIEKLVEIFGSQYDSEFREKSNAGNREVKEAASKLSHNPTQVLSNTRLFLLSRRSKSRTNLNVPDGNRKAIMDSDVPESVPRTLDLGKKKQIDRSMADLPPISPDEAKFPVTVLSPTQEIRESPLNSRKASESNAALPTSLSMASPLNSPQSGAKPKIMKPKATNQVHQKAKEPIINTENPNSPQQPRDLPIRPEQTNSPASRGNEPGSNSGTISRQKEDLRKDLDRLDEEIQSMNQSMSKSASNVRTGSIRK